MSSSIEEIKSRLSIEEVVARYVPLKKAGRNFKARCPFHNEKTPSFVVSPEKQLAYCLGVIVEEIFLNLHRKWRGWSFQRH